MPHMSNIPVPIKGAAYGVRTDDHETGDFDYICGVAVKDFAWSSCAWSCIRIPEQNYAVFRYPDHISTIRSAWNTIWNHWLPASPYEPVAAPAFERYDERFDPNTGKGGFEIWIPIQGKKAGAKP